MEQIIFTKTYAKPPVNRQEILRYMDYGRAREASQEVAALLAECFAEILPHLSYKVCWRIFPIQRAENCLDLGFMRTESCGLLRNLSGCDRLVLFAATVGLAPDRLIAKYGRISPAKALFMQAIGAERIESLCNVFCDELEQKFAAEGLGMKPRFSPGYGDFPLEAQKNVFQTLDCHRKIGLSLNDSLLMSPSKSVTALAGLFPKESNGKAANAQEDLKDTRSNCKACDKTDCEFRRN